MTLSNIFTVAALSVAAVVGAVALYDAITSEPGDELIDLETQIRDLKNKREEHGLTRWDLNKMERLVRQRDMLRDHLASDAASAVDAATILA